MSPCPRVGFTLIELSIVLVIIGLVVGVIVTGKALIQQAEVRAAASQLQKMETAYRTFQTKYGCIIGDCANATDFFGATYSAYCAGMPNGNANGDGNGLIDYGGGAWWQCEDQLAIKSLQLSNILPASSLTPCWGSVAVFNGINGTCAYFFNDDLYNKVPRLKLNNIGWAQINGSGALAAPALSPMQARLIDEKIDDGKPTTGKFSGLDASLPSGGAIVANSCVTSGAYNLNEDFTCRSLYYLK